MPVYNVSDITEERDLKKPTITALKYNNVQKQTNYIVVNLRQITFLLQIADILIK